MLTASRRRLKKIAATPDGSTRSTRKGRKTSGTSSVDTKDGVTGREKKTAVKSTWKSELARVLLHLLFVISLIFITVVAFEYHMRQFIHWEKPRTEEPQLRTYFGASIITKDFDCSVLARRCYMGKRKLRACFLPSLMCVSMLRPDMFPRFPKNQTYYINGRHVTSVIDIVGKKKEVFNTYHEMVLRSFIIGSLFAWNGNFTVPLTNSKGMPRDNQLFFIPWEILDMEKKYKNDLDYVDLNMDEVPDCIQPKQNTDVGRRDWIKSMNWPFDDKFKPDRRSYNHWRRDTTSRTDRMRVDTVPGFSGAFVKKIVDICIATMDSELSHSMRGMHSFTDDMLLLIYRHVLLHALRNPFLLMFKEEEWKEKQDKFDPESPVQFEDYVSMPSLTNVGPSISFLYGAHARGVNTKLPDTLAITISEARAKLNGKDFDLNVPIRISNGFTNVEIVSSSQGERAFHSNIITALRVALRLRINDETIPNFNDVLHIPMVFYSMEEKKMVFDRYSITTELRYLLCKTIERCATPYDQNSIDWQRRFNGTTAIQYNGKTKLILARVSTHQDKSNYAVGF